MSLDISLISKATGETVADMNWLRNPFGLMGWATDNAHHVWGNPPRKTESLWYVVNHWNYDKSPRINRAKFKQVVDKYAETLNSLEVSYLFFDLPAYRSFIEGKLKWFTTHTTPFSGDRLFIDGSRYDDKLRLMIPVEAFWHPGHNLGRMRTTADYQAWFAELVNFAELLQNPDYEFYCSN